MNRTIPIFLKGKTVLVSGSTGYLGSSLLERIRSVDCRILRLSRTRAPLPRLAGRATVETVSGDIRSKAVWERALPGVDVVFHLAAQTSVPQAEADPEADFEANVLPLLRLLDVCRAKRHRPAVLLAGTATQAGLLRRRMVHEGLPDFPVTTYDLHKLMAEEYLKLYAARGIVQGAALRLFNVYGPAPSASRSPSRGILNQMIRKAARGESLPLYGKGEAVRDYVYIDDVVEAFLRAAESIGRVNGRHFYVGSGKGFSLAQAFRLVATLCAAKTGRRVTVRSVPPPRGLSIIEKRSYVADTSRFRAAVGWKPRVTLREGILRTLDSILKS